MSDTPGDVKLLSSHEWIRLSDDGTAKVGISDHAQDAMGDLVYVELPEVGAKFANGEEAGVVESVKAASDIYSPMSGEVIAVNEALEDSPELVNESPYDDGWIFQIRFDNRDEYEELLTPEQYQSQVEAEE